MRGLCLWRWWEFHVAHWPVRPDLLLKDPRSLIFSYTEGTPNFPSGPPLVQFSLINIKKMKVLLSEDLHFVEMARIELASKLKS